MNAGLPLLSVRPPDDAWHTVASPGGYEWWRFDAHDAEQDIRLVAIFSQGWPFNQDYCRRYAEYRRRPTRNAPPVPAEYPAVYFAVHQNRRIVAECSAAAKPAEFAASHQTTDVTIGKNRFFPDGDGVLRVCLRGENPCAADLSFRSRAPNQLLERSLCPADLNFTHHRWIIAGGHCDVAGELRLPGRTIPFRGRGFHDHQYSAAPMNDFCRWIRGHVLEDERSLVFQSVSLQDSPARAQVSLIEMDACGARDGEGEMVVIQNNCIQLGQTIFTRPQVLNDLSKRSNYRRVLYSPLNGQGSDLICDIV